MIVGLSYLAAWALQKDQSPRQFVALDPLGLKYETCTITEWNFISMASKNPSFIKETVLNILLSFSYIYKCRF